MVPLDGSPALRTSATARELERLRAKRRILEAAAKSPSASVFNAGFCQTQQLPTPTSPNDPAIRNARIKASARKLLDQLQAADTNLGDSSNSLKLLFAKQALRALADRQAAAAAEAQQRKLDQLKERLEEEHRRQQQLIQQQQQQEQHQLHKERSPRQEPSAGRRRRSKSAERRHRTLSRRRSSPNRHVAGGDFSSSGCSPDSDTRTSDASSVRDTRRRSPSRSRGGQHHLRLRSQHAGPTETGLHGAVSAQALSALLAGLQLHGVNLTSGPPPLRMASKSGAGSGAPTDCADGGAPRSGASQRRRSSGRSGGSDSPDDSKQQYVLLPDGTVGLLQSVVKPAVLQPQPPSGMMSSPPPQGVPLVLMQHGSAVGGGSAGGTSPGAPSLLWPDAASPARAAYPYGAPPPPPSPLSMPTAYYPHLHSPYPYGHHAPPPHGYPYGYPVSPTLPPYLSPYGHPLHAHHPYGIDAFHGRHPGPAPPPPSPYPDASPHPYSVYPAEQPASPHRRMHSMASPTQPESHTDADQRHSFRNPTSPLGPNQYGNLPTPGIPNRGGPEDANDVRPQPTSLPSAAAVAAAAVSSSPQAPPSVSSLSGAPIAASPEPAQGGGPGGGGGYHGGHFHRHSHSGAESLRSLPSNSGGGSLRGGMAGSVSMSASQQYEATLASPSPRDSLQGLDSPASFRDMARRETVDSGSVSLSPLAGVHGSLDAGARSTISGSTRRGPSPLYASSLPDSGPSPAQTGATSGYDAESVVLRVGESSGQASQPTSPSGRSAFGTASELGPGEGLDGRRLPSSEEPSLMLRGLEMGSPLQRSKLSDDAETPTSRKASLTSPWSSSTLGPSVNAVEGSSGAAGGYGSQRDLLPDVVSRMPVYGVSLPYVTSGLYERYTGVGLYNTMGGGGGASSGGLYSTGQSSFGGFGVNPSGSTLAGGAGGSGSVGAPGSGMGGAGGMGGGIGLGLRTPSSESLRSGSTATGRYGQSLLPPPSAGGEVYGSAALALTAAILESSGPAGLAALSGNSVGLSAAAVHGLNQLGLGHLHPTASTTSPSSATAASPVGISGAIPQDTTSPTGLSANSPFAAMAGGAPSPTAAPGPTLSRSMSSNRVADSESGSMGAMAAMAAVPIPAAVTTGSSGGGSGGVPGAGGMGAGSMLASAANSAMMARLSHGADNSYSPRTRSRIQLMGNDDLTDILSSRSTSFQTPQSPGTAQQSSFRLSPAVLNAHQQQLQQQQQMHPQPSSPQQQQQQYGVPGSQTPQGPQQPTSAKSGNRGALTEITGQPSVPTLRLPAKAQSRTSGMAAAMAGLPPLPPAMATAAASGGGASAPSSGHGSPTRLEAQLGLGMDPRDRDTDGDLSQSVRSGRSMVSDGPSGPNTGPGVGGSSGGYGASGERAFISGGPVVEHRETTADASVYGIPPMPPAADAAAVATAAAVILQPAAAGSSYQQQQQQQQLPALLDWIGMGNIFAQSPSGSATGYSPLGFGGSSTPLERSNDSFVRIGSMPFSGAASPMAMVNPIDVLGSPTIHPLNGLQMQGGGSSSGGNSSGGGAAGSSGGARSAAVPTPSPPAEAAPAPLPTAAPSPPAPSLPPSAASPQRQQQVQLSGMSFRVSSPGVGPLQSIGSGGFTSTPIAASVASDAAGGGSGPSIVTSPSSASTPPPPLASLGFVGRTGSANTMGYLSRNSSKSLSLSSIKTPKPSSPSTPTGAGQRPRATSALLSRVLAGQNEFDSDEDELGGSLGSMEPSLTIASGRPSMGGSLGSLGLRGESGASTAAAVTSPGKPVAAGVRGSLAAGSAHDEEFNF